MADFNRLTRLADDSCTITSRDIRSIGPGNYAVSEKRQPVDNTRATAVANPTLVYNGSYGNAASAVIDDESILRNHSVQTHDLRQTHAVSRPQPRPFATVPYMGGGRGNADVESSVIHGEITRCGAECGTTISEMQWPVFAPLIKKVAENVQNPANLVQEVAAPGWIRAGLPSRQYARDNCQ